MNPLAIELNDVIKQQNLHLYEMLSEVGKNLFFPKGILTQGAEAKEKAHRFNATIGMATEKGRTMFLPSVMSFVKDVEPEDALTYAPSFGVMPLRKAWKEVMIQKNPSLSPGRVSLPVATHALTHGLSVIADMWVDPGDVILLSDKTWGNYNLIFSVRRGAKIVQYPLFNGAWKFNLEAFEETLIEQSRARGKVIALLNFPNNPTGYTVSPFEAERIAEILTRVAAGGTRLIALCDDAYFGLFYDETALHESIFCRLLDRDPRLLAIKVDGPTKEEYVWGLRVGFITYGACLEKDHEKVYNALERKTGGAVRGSISNVSHLSQSIILRSLQAPSHAAEKEDKYRIMQERAREVKRVLANPKYHDAWDVYPFNSGYFMCLKLKKAEAEPLRVHLLNTYGVGLISLGKQDLRVAFSCVEKEDLQELFDTILKGVGDLTAS